MTAPPITPEDTTELVLRILAPEPWIPRVSAWIDEHLVGRGDSGLGEFVVVASITNLLHEFASKAGLVSEDSAGTFVAPDAHRGFAQLVTAGILGQKDDVYGHVEAYLELAPEVRIKILSQLCGVVRAIGLATEKAWLPR